MSMHVPDAYNKYHRTTLIDNWVEEVVLNEVTGDTRRTTLKGNSIRLIDHTEHTEAKDYISVDHACYKKPSLNKETRKEPTLGVRGQLDSIEYYNTAKNILQNTQKVETKKKDVMTLHTTHRDDFKDIPDELRPPLPKRWTQDLKPAHYDPSLMTFHGLRHMPCTIHDNELIKELPDVKYDKDTPITFWTEHVAEGTVPMSAPEGENPFGRSSTFSNDIYDGTKIHATSIDTPCGYVSGMCTYPVTSAGNNLTLKPILEEFRHRFLQIAGISGIIGIRSIFHSYDKTNSSHFIQHDFHIICLNLQIEITQAQLQLLFATFDPKRTGYINYNEFLDYYYLPINEKRKETLVHIFSELSNHQSSAELNIILKHFNVYRFPSVKSKLVTPSFVKNDFEDSWYSIIEPNTNVVTEQNFIDYFSSYSSLLGDDKQFSTLLYECFELNPPAPPSTIRLHVYDIKGKLTKLDYEDIEGAGRDPLVIQHYLRTRYGMKNVDHVQIMS